MQLKIGYLFQCPPRASPWVHRDITESPCKGKSLVLRSFCPYRATFLLMYNPGCYPGLGASALSGRAGNLYQFINLTRRLSLQHFEFEVLSGYNAFASQNLLHGLSRQFGMIVLLTEMAEPDMAKDGCGIIG